MKNESDINYVKAAKIGIRFYRPFKGLKLTSDKVEHSNQNFVDKIIKKSLILSKVGTFKFDNKIPYTIRNIIKKPPLFY